MKRFPKHATVHLLAFLALTAGAAPALALPTADDVKQRIAAAGGADDYKGADWVVVLDESDVAVRDSGLATTDRCEIVKLLTEKGARDWAVQRFEFDPNANRIEIVAVRVYDADGEVRDIDLSEIAIAPAPAFMIYWGNRHKLLNIPSLEVGDSIELVTSKTGFNVAYLAGPSTDATSGETLQPPMPGHWYDIVRFDGSHPVIEQRYTVSIPRDKTLEYETYNGALASSLRVDGDRNVFAWWRTDFGPFDREPMSVAFDDIACKLVLATVPDWEEKSRWFFKANESQFELDDELRALVDEIVRNNPDEESQLRAMNHWVAENIRYIGTSRGPSEGFTVHKATETFRDRGGVCKDKAGILVAMLRAAGYESFVAMTMAGSRVEEVAADQFNHCVTTVRKKDGDFMMLDPTWAPKSRELWSSREQRQNVVYGTPQGEPLDITAYSPPEDNLFACKADSRLSSNGTLTTNYDIHMDDYADTSYRRWLDRSPPAERDGAITAKLQRVAPNVVLTEADYTDPIDFAAPSTMRLALSAKGFAPAGKDGCLLQLPLLRHPLGDVMIGDLLSKDATRLEERKHPLRMRTTRLLKYQDSITLPDGWQASDLPEDVTIDGPAASIHFTASTEPGRLDYTLELALKKHHVPPEDYAEFRKVIQAMNELSDRWIACGPKSDTTELAAGSADTETGGTH